MLINQTNNPIFDTWTSVSEHQGHTDISNPGHILDCLSGVQECTIYAAKTKVLISCVVTTQLIYCFVFAYVKSRFSHDMTQIIQITAEYISGLRVTCLVWLVSQSISPGN